MKLQALWLALLFTCMSFAQNTGTVSGKIIEKNSKNAVPYSNISIKKENKTITGGISQENGNFHIKGIPFGNFTIEIESIGFKKTTKTFTLSEDDKNVNLGPLLSKKVQHNSKP